MKHEFTEEQREQLEVERSEGSRARQIYETYIEDFCTQKRQSLFMSFSELPLTAEKEIMEVKRMLFAIDTLEAEIVSKINTGKMAAQVLNEAEQEKEVH